MTDHENTFWYAVYTRPRWEKKVARILEEKGIQNYCPLNKVRRRWSDRYKVVYEPLFKGYVFVKLPESKKWEIKAIDGILNYVYWLGKPAKIQDAEIDKIRKFLHEFENVEVTDFAMEVDRKVVISQGVLMNYQGVIVEILGNRARVRIDSMGIQLSAVFDKKSLQPL